jgi:lytic murein transglycosylase
MAFLNSRRLAIAALIAGGMTAPALAQSPSPACGGDLAAFLDGVKQEAVAKGIPTSAADEALAGAQIDPKVLSRDRAQGVFRQTFLEFSQRTVSQARLDIGRQKLKQYADVFSRAQSEFGVAPGVITAFWAMETDFGAVQGDFNTRNALVTLSHDCRRPQLFRPQLIALIEMVQHGDLNPSTNTGAWAGEIGQVQMLPEDIIAHGVDGDNSGHIDVKGSAPDAILTAAKFIQSMGYKPGQPWIQEVTLPESLPWGQSGLGNEVPASEWFSHGVTPRDGDTSFGNLPAALILPQGRKGPAFLAYPNFGIYLQWNQSFIYTTSAAYFATRLSGAPPYQKGTPEAGLDSDAMKELQSKLQAHGHDVGKIDGILGSGTRRAVQKEQARLDMPADGWPTPELLSAL